MLIGSECATKIDVFGSLITLVDVFLEIKIHIQAAGRRGRRNTLAKVKIQSYGFPRRGRWCRQHVIHFESE